MKTNLKLIFDRIIGVVFGVMLLFLTLSIVLGVVRMFMTLGDLIVAQELARGYQRIISDVLTLFILIELSRSLVEYFNTSRLRMTFIVDAAIVFVLREIMILLFEHKIEPAELYAMSALLFVMSALRIASVVVFQREKKMLEASGVEDRASR